MILQQGEGEGEGQRRGRREEGREEGRAGGKEEGRGRRGRREEGREEGRAGGRLKELGVERSWRELYYNVTFAHPTTERYTGQTGVLLLR